MNKEILEAIESEATFIHRDPSRDTMPEPSAPVYSFFSSAIIQGRIWAVLFFLAVAGGIFGILKAFEIGRRPFQNPAIVLDGAGGFHVAPFRGWSEAEEVHAQMSRNAASALLARTFEGPNEPEMLKRIFLGGKSPALRKASELWEAERIDFVAKKIRQHVEFHEIRMQQSSDVLTVVGIKGQLFRNGRVGEQLITEAPLFELVLTFVRNPDVTRNGRYPTAVHDFKFRILDHEG